MKLSPDDHFIPTNENVADIFNRYGLSLISYHEASSGIENRTLIADTSSGRYVVRIYRQGKKQLEVIQLELDFMKYLRANTITTPIVIANIEGQQITSMHVHDKTWQVIVMEFSDGEHADVYTKPLVRDLARIQAAMHTLSDSYHGATDAAIQLTTLRERHLIKQESHIETQDERLRSFIRRVEDYTVDLSPELPGGLCHLDFDKGNVLTKDDTVSAVLDFYDLANAPFVVCLAYTLWDVYTESGEQDTQDYITEYDKYRKLSEIERQYIRPVMLYRHYVIAAIKILDGHTSGEDVLRFVAIEDNLKKIRTR